MFRKYVGNVCCMTLSVVCSVNFTFALLQTAGQSLDGVVIPTPSLPTPSSTPRVKVKSHTIHT